MTEPNVGTSDRYLQSSPKYANSGRPARRRPLNGADTSKSSSSGRPHISHDAPNDFTPVQTGHASNDHTAAPASRPLAHQTPQDAHGSRNLAHSSSSTSIVDSVSQGPSQPSSLQHEHIFGPPARKRPSHFTENGQYSADLLARPSCRHPRLEADIELVAPLFVGGSSIEGYLRVVVDGGKTVRQRTELKLTKISVELLGIEELITEDRRAVFLSLGSVVTGDRTRPPQSMIEVSAYRGEDDACWTLRASRSLIPFRIALPLDVGPVPFECKSARIRYQLSASIYLVASGKQYIVRCSQNVQLLTTNDPEKALRSLPSPLMASDEWSTISAGMTESITVTAGLHRQIWISGTSLYVDININNRSGKTLRRLDISIERDVLCYKHAAAATLEISASQARIFQDKEQKILNRVSQSRSDENWHGVPSYSTMIRTCKIDIPRSHATIKCGKYFEVRFFLNVTVGTRRRRLAHVQLPIRLIHMNSLDIIPNAVPQVASAIEAQRSRSVTRIKRQTSKTSSKRERRNDRAVRQAPIRVKTSQSSTTFDDTTLQGRAFSAPRKQSLEALRLRPRDGDYEQSMGVAARAASSTTPSISQAESYNDRPLGRTASHDAHGKDDSASRGSRDNVNRADMHYYTPPPRSRSQQSSLSSRHASNVLKHGLRTFRSLDVLNRSTPFEDASISDLGCKPRLFVEGQRRAVLARPNGSWNESSTSMSGPSRLVTSNVPMMTRLDGRRYELSSSGAVSKSPLRSWWALSRSKKHVTSRSGTPKGWI